MGKLSTKKSSKTVPEPKRVNKPEPKETVKPEAPLTPALPPEKVKELEGLLDELEQSLKISPTPEEASFETAPEPGKKAKSKKAPKQSTVQVVIDNEEESEQDKPKNKSAKSGNIRTIEPTDGEVITVKELAFELGTDPRKLRRWLREHYGQAEGRWEWHPQDPILKEISEKFAG